MGKIDNKLFELGFDVDTAALESKHCRIYDIPGSTPDQHNRKYARAKKALEQMAAEQDRDIEICPLSNPPRIRIKLYPSGALPR